MPEPNPPQTARVISPPEIRSRSISFFRYKSGETALTWAERHEAGYDIAAGASCDLDTWSRIRVL